MLEAKCTKCKTKTGEFLYWVLTDGKELPLCVKCDKLASKVLSEWVKVK